MFGFVLEQLHCFVFFIHIPLYFEFIKYFFTFSHLYPFLCVSLDFPVNINFWKCGFSNQLFVSMLVSIFLQFYLFLFFLFKFIILWEVYFFFGIFPLFCLLGCLPLFGSLSVCFLNVILYTPFYFPPGNVWWVNKLRFPSDMAENVLRQRGHGTEIQ